MTCRVSFAFGLCAVLAIAAATTASATPQDTPSIRLLTTNREAERVRVLKDGFENHLTDDVPAGYAELKSIVQDLIVRQLDAAPAISDGMLLEQLRKVIGQTWDGTLEEGLYVRSGGGAKG